MVSRGDRISVLYPEYFDSSLSRAEGRRVSAKAAVQSPTVQDIEKAARELDLNPVIEESISYPKRWWRSGGRVLVQKKYPKGKLLKFIGTRMSLARGASGAAPKEPAKPRPKHRE